jgi:O-antigen ligase
VLAGFFLLRANVARVLTLLVILIFVDNVFLSDRKFFFVAFSISSAFAYTLLMSLALTPAARARMPALNGTWLGLLTFAFAGTAIAATNPRLGFADTLPVFQLYYLEGLIYFWIARGALTNAGDASRVFRGLALLGGLAAVLHMISLATGITFSSSGITESQRIEAAEQVFRYGSVFANPNTLADFYAMVLPMTLVMLLGWSRPRAGIRAAMLASAGLMFISLPLTASRGGLATAAVNGVIVLLLLPLGARQILTLVGSALVLGGIAITGLFMLFPDFLTLSIERLTDLGTADVRYRLWSATVDILMAHPLGVGIHYYSFEQALASYGMRLVTPHNILLGVAVDTGLPGLAMFVLLCGSILRRTLIARRVADRDVRTAATATLMLLSGFLIGGMTEPIFTNGYKLNHLFFISAGIASALPSWARRAREAKAVAAPPDASGVRSFGGPLAAPGSPFARTR